MLHLILPLCVHGRRYRSSHKVLSSSKLMAQVVEKVAARELELTSVELLSKPGPQVVHGAWGRGANVEDFRTSEY